VFSYYGKTLFAIAMFREVDDPKTIPKFHSRSLDAKGTFFFDVWLLEFDSQRTMKVNLMHYILLKNHFF
jgi:hypothetical protein